MKLAPSPIQDNQFGLLAQLESTRVPLPLKALEIEAQITGDLVSVELDQLFLQDHSEPLNCTYTFPLPANAAVYRCEMHVGDRVIEAKTKTRDDARRVFEKMKEDGRRAALAEMARENLFNLELGNLQPGDLIRVRFAYVQQLETLDDLRSLRLPLTPSIRYVPGRVLPRANRGTGTADDTDEVPDASRLSPPRIDSLHPDAATFHAHLRIDSRRDQLNSLRSPSHDIEVLEGEEDTVVTLRGNDQIPSRDFVIEWATRASSRTAARAWVSNHRNQRYALLEVNGGPKPPEKEEESRDLYLLLDRSGSMGGQPWSAACRAVHSLVRSLPSGTRVDLTLFESRFTHFTGQPRPAGELLNQLGEQASSLTALGVTGGTKLLPAFDATIRRKNQFSGDRPASLLILTDGMIANERAIIDSARKSGTAVHLLGIGLAPNDAMRAVAESTGGQVVFVSPQDDLENLITRFSSRVAKPLLDDLVLPEGWIPANEYSLTGVFPGEQRRVLLRGEEGAALKTLRAREDGKQIDLELETREIENPALPLLWARQRIRHLESHGQVEEALDLSLRFNLPSSQTSFVAWDREEQVTVAARHLHQPALDPEAEMLRLRKERIEAKLLRIREDSHREASIRSFDGNISKVQQSCAFEELDLDDKPLRTSIPSRPDESLPQTKDGDTERSVRSLDAAPMPEEDGDRSAEEVKDRRSAEAPESGDQVGSETPQVPESDRASKPGILSRILGMIRKIIRRLSSLFRGTGS